MATAVAIATVLSLIGGYIRAPEAVLGVAFARACAAEAAVAERSHPRLRIDREDVHVEDADALPVAAESTKSVVRRPDTGPPSLRFAALSLSSAVPDVGRVDQDPGLAWLPIGPPTRERARLMVFLN